jgi:hypothetical protein
VETGSSNSGKDRLSLGADKAGDPVYLSGIAILIDLISQTSLTQRSTVRISSIAKSISFHQARFSQSPMQNTLSPAPSFFPDRLRGNSFV